MFVIITPTYKRAELLKRAVLSVQSQSFSDWKMIIVNDSPDDISYAEIEKYITEDNRVIYLKNETNQGVNYSRNKALQYAQDNHKDSWIIFLDDDDYLADKCLEVNSQLITRHPEYKWFVTNRKGSTHISPDLSAHAYTREWLIFRTLKGDATHCISFTEIQNIRFSKNVRQAEEWMYFYQVSLVHKYKGKNFLYHDVDTTLSDGYALEGLNFRLRNKDERRTDLENLIKEGEVLGISKHIGFRAYTLLRKIKLLFQS